MKLLYFAGYVVAWSALTGAAATSDLQIFSGEHPVSFFFREMDASAERQKIPYEEWATRYGRLSGVMGKMLDEEIVGRSATQGYFRRFKAEHPTQAVLLHTNPNFRSPKADNQIFFAGHWLYYNGAKVLDAVPADGDQVTLRVSDSSVFQLSPYAVNAAIPDDVGLCALTEDGRPDWSRAEQTQLVAIDSAHGTITVRRAQYGSVRQTFGAGRAYVAAHVAQTWGTINKLWQFNLSTSCPRDAAGRNSGEVWVNELIRAMQAGGPLDYVDGVEFDVPFRRPIALSGTRRADCDADGRPDDGVVSGQPVFATGLDQFFRTLRTALPDRLIMADTGDRAQRSLDSVNGVETEGWPRLRDPEFTAWSTAMNDHRFWEQRARAPIFTYGLLKFRETGPVPFSSVRLALAGPLLTGSAVPSAYSPPEGSNGIWDELLGGAAGHTGWLGHIAGPERHLALDTPDLLSGKNLTKLISAPEVEIIEKGPDILIRSRQADSSPMIVRIRGIVMDHPGDLVVKLGLSAAPLPGYPVDSYRLIGVTVVPAGQQFDSKHSGSTTPANARGFESIHYLRDVAAGPVDLVLSCEGSAEVTVHTISVHVGPDVMAREFAHGVVLANPSAHPFTFRIGTLFPGLALSRLQATANQDAVTNNGQPAGNEVTLGPRDALFLQKTGSSR